MHDDLEARLRAARSVLGAPDATLAERIVPTDVPRLRRPRRVAQRVGWVAGTAGAVTLAAVLGVLLVQAPDPEPARQPAHWQPGDVVVPDLRGMQLASANQAIPMEQADGGGGVVTRQLLNVRASSGRRTDAQPPGTILDHSPAPGERVARGTYIRVSVAAPSGPNGERTPLGAFSLPMIAAVPGGGPTFSERDLSGVVSIVTFVAPSCPVCDNNRDALQYLTVGTDVNVVATRGATRAYAEGLRKTGQSYGVALDQDGALAQRLGITTVPTTLVVDREARIAASFEGALAVEDKRILEVIDSVRAEQQARDDPTRVPRLGLSVEDTPPLDPSLVPDEVLAGATGGYCEVDPTQVRLLATGSGGTRLYLARGPRHVTTVDIARGARRGGISCGFGPMDPGSKPSLGGSSGPGGVTLATAIVPDGYTEAIVLGKRIPIENNGLVLDETYPKDTTVTFTGPAGTVDVPILPGPPDLQP